MTIKQTELLQAQLPLEEVWSDYVDKVVHTNNCTTSEAVGYSPFYLLFVRNLPINLIFGIKNEEVCKHTILL